MTDSLFGAFGSIMAGRLENASNTVLPRIP